MKTVFVDTNFFIQCRGIDTITWADLFDKNETISILIPRAVQKEVDNFKGQGKGRRSKKAKSANELFGLILDSVNGYELNERLTLSFTSKKELAHIPSDPSLDTTKNDDSIIQEVIAYRTVHPEADALLLTNDTGLMVSAKEYGVPYLRIPASWLLEDEPDEKDKQIKALQAEITSLKKSYPEIKIEVNARSIQLKINEYEALPDSIIKNILGGHAERSKLSIEDYQQNPYSFMAVSKEQIERYNQQQLSDWQRESARYLKNFHLALHRKLNAAKVAFNISNQGTFPAENILVEFTTSENLILYAPFDLTEEAIVLPPIPKPPSSILSRALGSGLEHRDLSSLVSSLSLQETKGTEGFYWKEGTYSKTKPMKSVLAGCKEFRHKAGTENFSFFVTAKYGTQVTGGVITCKVSARNIHEPIISTVTINCEYAVGETLSETNSEIKVTREK